MALDTPVTRNSPGAAERARRRGGYGAVTAGYERAAQLTSDPQARARRLLAAAVAANDAGRQDRALELGDQASGLSADPLLQADVALLRLLNQAEDLHQSLPAAVAAASAIEAQHPRRAAEVYTTAITHASAAGSDFHPLARQITARLSELRLPPGTMRPCTRPSPNWASPPARNSPPCSAGSARNSRNDPSAVSTAGG